MAADEPQFDTEPFDIMAVQVPPDLMEFVLWSASKGAEASSAEAMRRELDAALAFSPTLGGPWSEIYVDICITSGPSLSGAFLRQHPSPGQPAVFGRVAHSGHSGLEWEVVAALLAATARLPSVRAYAVDGDGDFLAVEAAHALPAWCTPLTAPHRLLLAHGAVHLVPPSRLEGSPPSLAAAGGAVHSPDTAAGPDVKACIAARVAARPPLSGTQRLVVRLPPSAAAALRAAPALATAAAEAASHGLVTPAVRRQPLYLPCLSDHTGLDVDHWPTLALCLPRPAAAALACSPCRPHKYMPGPVFEAVAGASRALEGVSLGAVLEPEHRRAWELRLGVQLTQGLAALHSLVDGEVGWAEALSSRLAVVAAAAGVCQGERMSGKAAAADTSASSTEGGQTAHTAPELVPDAPDPGMVDCWAWLEALQQQDAEQAGGADAQAALPQLLAFLDSQHGPEGVGSGVGAGEAAQAGDASSDSEGGGSSDSEGGGVEAPQGGGGDPLLSAVAQAAARWDALGGAWMDSGSDSEGEATAPDARQLAAAAEELMDAELGHSTLVHSFQEGAEEGATVPVPDEGVVVDNFARSWHSSSVAGGGVGPVQVTLSQLPTHPASAKEGGKVVLQ